MTGPRMPHHSGRLAATITAVLLIAAVLLTFATAPKSEDFWWSDAATFALNGELIHDYIARGLGQSPMTFASNWFLHYPALTISLYPPILPVTEALAFTVFGFSHVVAQAVISLFALICAFGCWAMVRTATSRSVAVAAALLLFATPGVLLWSRQVMMEVPTMAFLVLAAAMLLRYQSLGGQSRLYAAVVLLIAAVYTKQTAIFAAPAFALALMWEDGVGVLRAKSTWISIVGGIFGLVPLVLFTIKFAAQNIDSAIGQGTASSSGDVEASHVSWHSLTVYGLALPEIAGWLALAGAVGYIGLIVIRGWEAPSERRLFRLMCVWFATDYLMISVIGHFEARYGIFLAVPIVVMCILFVSRIVPERWRSALPVGLAGAIFCFAVYDNPEPRMTGYDKVAEYIADHAGKNDVILLHCYESKNFVFSMRVREPEPKVFIVRTEKLLVDYNILRQWGIADRNVSREGIESLIDKLGVSFVVMQPDFWADQPSMARFQEVVRSDRFTEVATFPIESDEASQRTVIGIYKNNYPTNPADRSIDLDMRALGGAILGRLGAKQ
jgi:hypothetical protein